MIAEVLIVLAFVTLAFLYGRYKDDIGSELVIAGMISIVWVVASGVYNYDGFRYDFFGVSVYPFILWTTALVLFKEFSEFLDKVLKNPFQYWGTIVLSWIGIMLIAEWIGYHVGGIRLGNGDPGLLGFDVLHLPVWGQLYYLFAGIGFVIITKIMRVK